MSEQQLLDRLFPNAPTTVSVCDVAPRGLLLSDLSALHWPEQYNGVVLQFHMSGDVCREWWPGEPGYDDLLELFKLRGAPQTPQLRVVGGQDDE